MSVSDVAVTEARAANAYARADTLAAPAAVRPTDAARPRFDIADAPATKREAHSDSRNGAVRPDAQTPQGRAASAAIGGGGDSGYLAQALAQADEDRNPPPSAFRAATAAYGAQRAGEAPMVEVISPFPRLASGRALDLSV